MRLAKDYNPRLAGRVFKCGVVYLVLGLRRYDLSPATKEQDTVISVRPRRSRGLTPRSKFDLDEHNANREVVIDH